MPIRRCDHVKVTNLKLFGWRGNSDGIDICNSRDVEVSDCFVRTFDDLVVIKTDLGQGEARDITVRHCVLWNELAHALSLGAELREPITNVHFTDCDIIHDKGREWLLRIFNCDSAVVKNITFDNIRIEEARKLVSLWIGKAVWSKQAERGHIENVSFQDITSVAPANPNGIVSLQGFDATHAIENVQFQHVLIGGKSLDLSDIKQNEFVHNVTVLH
jgi:polygalacturonase